MRFPFLSSRHLPAIIHSGNIMEDCCAPGGSSGGNDALVHLEEGRAEGMALGDAPMAACCERELEDRKEANRVRTILQRFDPSTKSERERQRVVGTAGPPDAMGMGALSLGDGEGDGLGDGDDDDLDDDDSLERYRAQRLRELQEKGGGRDEGGAAKGLRLEVGKGVVPSVDNVALQGLLKTHAESRWNGGGARAPTLLVCQFSVKGDAFSHELSEVVDEIAATDFFGTNFVRVEKVKGVVVNQRDKGECPPEPANNKPPKLTRFLPSCVLAFSLSQ